MSFNKQVTEFMERFSPEQVSQWAVDDEGQKSFSPDTKVYLLRKHLILEEHGELLLAYLDGDRAETLKELCDLYYVCAGLGVYLLSTTAFDMLMTPKERAELDALPVDVNGPGFDLLVGSAMLEEALVEIDRSFLNKNGGLLNSGMISMKAALDCMTHSLGFLDVIEDAFAEVHASNMSKLDDDGNPVVSAAGRVVKSVNYRKPDLSKFL